MQRLWTPWRMEYILSEKQPGCIFCAALAQHDDRETYIVYRSARAFAMLNTYPYNNGHLMVVPYEHSADLNALDAETQADLMRLMGRTIEWLRAASKPEGFNVGTTVGPRSPELPVPFPSDINLAPLLPAIITASCIVLVLVVVFTALRFVSEGALIASTQQIETGGTTTGRTAWNGGWRFAWRLFLITFLLDLTVAIPALIAIL